jgi:hypothetical protein
MAHYAFLDSDNIVTEVITGRRGFTYIWNESDVDWELADFSEPGN